MSVQQNNYILEKFFKNNLKKGDNVLEFGPALVESRIFIAKYCKENNINYYCLEKGKGYNQSTEEINFLIKKYDFKAELCDYGPLFHKPKKYSSYKLLKPKFFDCIITKSSWPIQYYNSLFKVADYVGKDNYKAFFLPWTIARHVTTVETEKTQEYFADLINNKIKKPKDYKVTYYEDDEFERIHYLMRHKGLIYTRNL